MLKMERRQSSSAWMPYVSPLLAGVLTLISGAIVFSVLGQPPLYALKTFLITPVADSYGIAELCVKAGPILLCALGLSVAYRANVWNIGAEGQLLMGGLAGSALAVQFTDSDSVLLLPMVLICGMAAGLLWAGIAALLKTQFNTNEILTTIMLNYIAFNLLQYAVHGPLKDPHGFNFPESAMFADAARLPILWEETRVHLGIILALISSAGVWVLLSKSFMGYQIQVLGNDERAARMAGYKQKRLVWFALLLSGGLAGLAGVGEVAGPIGQLVPQISPGYGYAAIIVAFLGRLHPIGVVLASVLMALLYMGGEMVQIELNLPLALTGMFQGMLLFYLLACDMLIQYRLRWVSPNVGNLATASD
ncbi:ABC transporter permease [Ketobacter sp. MCCC 1A13808]|uniref:ABC transporter permease n=1 Tax=Ketobacter sp. MCCC 1A13808 TaxID=2602738 RepID=UPI0012EC4089|nr:ABC transporter permease [Ketobacter sp. MCCC 1A13808]MVF12068.1 ABC transporter permease [Ketobacter sp. MCCC 1A13808]